MLRLFFFSLTEKVELPLFIYMHFIVFGSMRKKMIKRKLSLDFPYLVWHEIKVVFP